MAIATPLYDLTKKVLLDKVDWSPATEQTFQIFKSLLTSEPILRNPDFTKLFIIHTDASEPGISVVLVQEFKEEEHPSLCISRKLSLIKHHSAAIKRLALASKWAIEELHFYLTGQ